MRIKRGFVPIALSVAVGICLGYREYGRLLLLAGVILPLICTNCANKYFDRMYEERCTPKAVNKQHSHFGAHLLFLSVIAGMTVWANYCALSEDRSFAEQMQILEAADGDVSVSGVVREADDEATVTGVVREADDEAAVTGVVREADDEASVTGVVRNMDDEVVITGVVREVVMDDGVLKVTLTDVRMTSRSSNGAKMLWDGVIRMEKRHPSLKVGEQVEFTGKLSPFREATNPGEFSSRSYERARGVSFSMYDPALTGRFGLVPANTPSGLSFLVRRKLMELRELLGKGIDLVAPENCRGILRTLILGQREELEEELYDLYSRHGVGHILAVSGLHLGIVGLGFYHLLRKIPIPGSFAFSGILSVVSLGLYVELTGTTISGQRALIMMFLYLLAEGLGRKSDGANSLCCAAAVILLRQPKMLFESAFLFSVLSVGAVHIISPLLGEWLDPSRASRARTKGRSTSEGLIPDSLVGGISIAWTGLPINACFYYSWPLHGILLNLVVLPVLPLIWYLGAAAAVFGAMAICINGFPAKAAELLGKILLFPVSGLLELMTRGLTFISGAGTDILPVYHTGCPLPWQLTLYVWISVIFLSLLHLILREERRRSILRRFMANPYGMVESENIQDMKVEDSGEVHIGVFWPSALRKPFFRLLILMLFLPCILLLKRPRTTGSTVTFLDVGQGNCTVLEFPDGRVGVADCGSTSVSNVGRYRLIQYLAYLGYGNHINEVWLSHFDEDHVNGFLDVLDRGMIIDHLNISAEVADESLEGMDSSSAPLSESSSKSSADSSSDHENFRSVEEIIRKVEERGGTVELWKAGDSMTFEPSACITCLWPLNTDGIGDNDNSQVLLYEYEGTRILLTGDITTAGAEEELIGLMKEALTPKEFFPVTVLQLPHHGSKYSSSEEFLSFFSPEQAVCSVGVNRYGHPTPEVIRRVGNVGVELYRTDQDGCVTVRMEGERVEVMTYSR